MQILHLHLHNPMLMLSTTGIGSLLIQPLSYNDSTNMLNHCSSGILKFIVFSLTQTVSFPSVSFLTFSLPISVPFPQPMQLSKKRRNDFFLSPFHFSPFLCPFFFPFPISFISVLTSWEQRGKTEETKKGTIFSLQTVPDHQVAGHEGHDGMLGPLIDDSGHFYKPLQDDDRGSNEVAFYKSFSSNTQIPDHVRRFFPIFYGTRLIEASDGSGLHPHLVLQDTVSSHLNPSIMDIKIGSRTWYPQASEDYIQKCLKKDRDSTSIALGFRISGLQVHGSQESETWKPDKKLVKKFTAKDVRLVLRKFVSSNTSVDTGMDPDCSFASTVYGGSAGILAQLLELKKWFEDQTIYHFYSCSVLMVYDKESVVKERNSGAEVKLVDFAHVLEGKGVIDHNFLGGLCSLIKFITDILSCSDEYEEAKASLQDPDKNCNCTD